MAVLNKLKAKEVEAIHKQKKVGKHADGGGLYLHVTDAGGFYWRYKYRIDGKEKLASFGTYPEVSLADARIKHLAARDHVETGDDPLAAKRRDAANKKIEATINRPFREIAQEWLDELIEPQFGHQTVTRYKRHVKVLNAEMGSAAISEIVLPQLSTVLLKYQRQGNHETRRRVQQCAVWIMGFAVGRGYLKVNPFLGASFAEAYTSPGSVQESRPAITDRVEFGRLLTDIERAPDRLRRGLRLLTLTMVRPGELRKAKWANINWKQAKMIVPFEVQKMRTERKGGDRDGKDFEVPLSRQAIVELQALYKETGHTPYLFPAMTDKNKEPFLGDNSFNSALTRLGYQGIHCAHGFRSSGSTMLNEERLTLEGVKVLRWPDQKALIEVQLDHNDASTQAIYDRGGRWEERCEIMQLWADRIDEMRTQRLEHLRLVA